MGIPCYLAMTAAEFLAHGAPEGHMAWMACHFSCYGTGLSNLPDSLPPGSMVIINDRTPIQEHDPEVILAQVNGFIESIAPDCILLDFQRPDDKAAFRVAELLTKKLSCPVGVTDSYAKELGCPVFLAPNPVYMPLKDHLAPWQGREVWLDMAPDSQIATVDSEGCRFAPLEEDRLPEPVFTDESLCCRYHTEVNKDGISFQMHRGKQEISALLKRAEELGVTRAVGLYQQLSQSPL